MAGLVLLCSLSGSRYEDVAYSRNQDYLFEILLRCESFLPYFILNFVGHMLSHNPNYLRSTNDLVSEFKDLKNVL